MSFFYVPKISVVQQEKYVIVVIAGIFRKLIDYGYYISGIYHFKHFITKSWNYDIHFAQ